MTIRIGLTLPSFVDDPETPIAVAQAAERAGIDGVFVYDHLWRGDPPNRRPALECFALYGAVAAETERVQVGTLVARATLRPPATLANAYLTAHRVSGGRLIAAIGSGDSQSREENEAFGIGFGSMVDRVAALHDSVRAAAGAWNMWGSEPEVFAAEAALVREVAPGAELTWGGLARPLEEGAVALAERLRPYADVGASWLVVGPVDSSNPDNAAVVGEVREILNASATR